MKVNSLHDKKVVVIGGTSGIGMAIASAALDEGARVVVASSRQANVQAALKRLEGAAGFAVDVKDEGSVATFFKQVGPFDHLAFTAGDWGGGLGFGGSARELDLAAAQAAFTVRFWGALAVVKHGSRAIAEGGSITLTDGMLAHRPMKGAPIVTAMTGAIEHLTRALAVDLAPVRVNAVCPGRVMTEGASQLPEHLRRTITRLPLPRGAEPAEVAEAYLYLMRGGYTTGQVLLVDGGGSVV